MQIAYVVIPGNPVGQRIGIVKFGESGYYQTNYDNHESAEQCREHVRLINERLNITPEVADAMLAGSMFGWHVPGAAAARDFFGVVALDIPTAYTEAEAIHIVQIEDDQENLLQLVVIGSDPTSIQSALDMVVDKYENRMDGALRVRVEPWEGIILDTAIGRLDSWIRSNYSTEEEEDA